MNRRATALSVIVILLSIPLLLPAQTQAGKKRKKPFSPQASALTGKTKNDLRATFEEVTKGLQLRPFYQVPGLGGVDTTGNWLPQDDGSLKLVPREGEEGWKRFSAYLWSDQAHEDFAVAFDFNLGGPGGNSGFYFRVADRDNPVETGCEFQLNDTHAKGAGINHHDIGGLLKAHPAAINAGRPAGEWNRAVIRVEGDRFRAWLNGFRVHDINLSKTPLKNRPRRGFLGFQDHGEAFSLRNVRIAVPPREKTPDIRDDPADDRLKGIKLTDPDLSLGLLDSDPGEFFLSHDMDLAGRLYMGGREAVFVYERRPDGGFLPRRELIRFPKDSWIYDLETIGDDLLILSNTALHRLHDALGPDPKLERILWGNPLGHHHQGNHGMQFAPDGALLIALGDPHPGVRHNKTRPDHLWHWTWYVGPGERKVPYTGVGAVMRLDLDSLDFSVFAGGLRNPCGISFDRDWNLFANDNDQEGTTGSPCRLVYVPPHSWNGWARGWDTSLAPARLDLLPNVNWTIDVPVSQGYYDDDALGAGYRGSLLVSNWGNRSVTQHPVRRAGGGFVAGSKPFLQADGIRRPVSAFPMNDGRLLVSLCHMQGNETSPIRQTDVVIVGPRDPARRGAFDHSATPLIELLGGPLQLRAKAHREILRRGGETLHAAAKTFTLSKPDDPAFSSLIFLAVANGDAAHLQRIAELTRGEDRAASLAWRTASAYPDHFAERIGHERIESTARKIERPRLLLALLEYLHATQRPIPDAVTRLAAHDDPFVRQSAAILLARRATPSRLHGLAQGNAEQRLAGTLASVFQLWAAAESVTELPADAEPALAKRMKLLHPEGAVDLKERDAPVGTFLLADWWRDPAVREANSAVFARLQSALADPDERVALTAATGLFFLQDKRVDAAAIAVLKRTGTELSMVKAGPDKKKMRQALAALETAVLSNDTTIPDAFRGIDWDKDNAKGVVTKGKELFTGRGCIVCHIPPDDGAGGAMGPSLVGVGQRFAPSYLAASMLVPNLNVSPNFHPNTITMRDGTVHTGYAEPGAASGTVRLRVITGQVLELDDANIVKQEASEQSMMPAGLIQTPGEMRDMIAYLQMKPSSEPARKKKRTKKKKRP